MDMKELFIRYMSDVTNIALATVAGGAANVRAVSIGFDEADPGVVYFSTFADSAKVKEIQHDSQVVFIPLPDKSDTDVTIRVHGTASTADITMERLAELIGRHLPDFAAQLPDMAAHLVIYQIRFEQAEISVGMTDPDVISF